MATRLTRWPAIFGGALLFGAAALYLGAPAPRTSVGTMLSSNRRWVVWDSLRIVDRALDRAKIRSGAYRVLEPSPGQVAGAREEAPDGRVRPAPSEWLGPYRAGLARLPVHVAEVGTVVQFEWSWDNRFVAPDAADSSTCFVRGWVATPQSPVDTSRALGPCGYYAAFGRPGPRIGAWMSSSFAGYAAKPPGWRYRPDTTDWDRKNIRNWQLDGWGLRLVRAGLPPAYFGAMNAAGCLAGRSGRCVDAMMADRPSRIWFPFSDPGLGSVDELLLPDLVAHFGVDRFRRFWRSDREVPEAFGQAFGVPMGEWVRTEALAYYGPLDAGAGDLDRSAVTALGWSLVLLLLTAMLARRLRH